MDSYNLQTLIDNRLRSQADIQQQIVNLRAEAAAFQSSIDEKIGNLAIQSHQYEGQIALLQALVVKGAILSIPDIEAQPEPPVEQQAVT